MKLETMGLYDLLPDPNNARTHDEKNLQAIKDSLQNFGQRKPIVITQDNVVVAGNGTLEAAKALEWETIQCVRVPADWNENQIKAFAIADNRTAELANWDQSVLEKQLEELEKSGFEVAELGFEVPELPIQDIEVEEDSVPDVPENPRSKTGDKWQLGKHTLVVGDSTKEATLRLALGERQADLILTDPPYNVAYEGGTKEALTIENDDMGDEQFKAFLQDFFNASYEIVKEGAPIYVFHADGSGNAFRETFIKSGFLLKQILIWVKDSLVLSRQDYNWQHEPILYGWKPGAGHKWYGPYTNTTVLDFEENLEGKTKAELVEFIENIFEASTIVREKRPRRNDLHPTMKPLALVSKLLKNSMSQKDVVLDPFAGSGATLIAAEQLGVASANVEMDPRYADVIIQRWEILTGQEAVLLNGTDG